MQIINDRRALHQIPELGYDLPETLEYLTQSLKMCGCEIFYPIRGSVCAWFDFGCDSAIAFRADIDALPIPEKTGLPFASRHEGKMHACGHDGHAAVALELARRLSRKKSMPYNVLLIFQPAEESTGGAKPICDTGIFDKYRVKAIFGLHVWAGLPAGTVASRKGTMMSLASELTVEVSGRSAHISKPAEGLDSLAAAMEFYRQARIIEGSAPDGGFCLLNFGKMESGNVRNAISDHTRLEGSLRTFTEEVYEAQKQALEALAREITETTGCAVTLDFAHTYPPITNPDALYDKVASLVPLTQLPAPDLGTEDFSWYQHYVPGMFFFLGLGDVPALHSDNFNFDETILLKGADLFETIAENIRL